MESKKRKKSHKTVAELISSICLFLVFSAFLFMASQLKMAVGSTTATVNAKTFPYIFCGLGAILSLSLIIRYAKRLVAEKKAGIESIAQEPTAQDDSEAPNDLRAIGSILLGVVFILLIYNLGIVLGGWIYLGAQIFILIPREKRNRKTYIIGALVSLAVPVLVYVPFRYIFQVMLPMGIFKHLF